ncbi:MAG: protein translocase subunit SecF [Clostridium sp.]
MYKIIEKSKYMLCISLSIIVIGMAFICFRGLNFGLDFRGGTQVVIDMEGKDGDKTEIDEIVNKYAEGAVSNTVTENDGSKHLEIKAKEVSSENVHKMYKELKEKYGLEGEAPLSEDTIGASIGEELKTNSLIALAISFVVVLIYIAIRFEFKFGVAALVATAHDILFTLSIYAIFNIPVNTPFIAAILTIVGYSMNDTIVIFDRIRENSKIMRRTDDVEVANKSLTQTLSRSINTSLTTLITVGCVYIFVPTVREFSFPLLTGIAVGAYSSIFVAAPTWVLLRKKLGKGKKKVKTA